MFKDRWQSRSAVEKEEEEDKEEEMEEEQEEEQEEKQEEEQEEQQEETFITHVGNYVLWSNEKGMRGWEAEIWGL